MERATWTHRLNYPQQPLPGYQPPVPSVICCCCCCIPTTCFFFFSQPAATTFHLPAFSTQLGIIPPSESPLIVMVAHEVIHVYIHACLHALEVAWGRGFVAHDLGVPVWTLVRLPEVATRWVRSLHLIP